MRKNITLHARKLSDERRGIVDRIVAFFDGHGFNVSATQESKSANGQLFKCGTMRDPTTVGMFLSLGGDGTFLETVNYSFPRGTPVLGINLGQMGFLTSCSTDTLEQTLEDIFEENYRLEARCVISLETAVAALKGRSYALNEFSIIRKAASAMIRITAYLDDELLNTYRADGLILATPTGSTGYSLSCGGPIMFPNTRNFILTPVSPHNLYVRPVVVPDTSTLRFVIDSRGEKFNISLDTAWTSVEDGTEFVVKKAPFQARIVKRGAERYVDTLRAKFNWGIDGRDAP